MARAQTGKIVSQTELAAILGVQPNTLKAWERKGMPTVRYSERTGQAAQYNTADVIRWREKERAAQALGDNREMEVEEAKRRKLAAEASSAEIDLEVKRGALVPVDEVAAIVEAEYSTVRANLMAMGGEIAPELEHLSSVEIEAKINTKVAEILKALSAEDQYVGEGEARDDDTD